MRLAAVFFVLLCVTRAFADEVPKPSLTDPRIQSLEYDPDQVILLQGSIGYQIMVEFSPGETLENVAIGDSLAWQVTVNKNASRLFLKPLDPLAVTNLTVVTGERRYLFELRVAEKDSPIVTPFVLRFNYPQPVIAVAVPPEAESPPQVVNSNYGISGPAENRPSRVFDDGQMVYFQWPANAEVPAIFAVSADGSESLINYSVHDGYIVVDELSPRFSLRDGKQVVTVVNYNLFTPERQRRK
ncbi:MAG TPA: TrbG/VirB9 family P-type conjugative transfer protein [Micropepsaceae bacterium]|nr:TrbG/VirB9 family P-type conjugative transfer protein [Micropepsaceae bacterium]